MSGNSITEQKIHHNQSLRQLHLFQQHGFQTKWKKISLSKNSKERSAFGKAEKVIQKIKLRKKKQFFCEKSTNCSSNLLSNSTLPQKSDKNDGQKRTNQQSEFYGQLNKSLIDVLVNFDKEECDSFEIHECPPGDNLIFEILDRSQTLTETDKEEQQSSALNLCLQNQTKKSFFLEDVKVYLSQQTFKKKFNSSETEINKILKGEMTMNKIQERVKQDDYNFLFDGYHQNLVNVQKETFSEEGKSKKKNIGSFIKSKIV